MSRVGKIARLPRVIREQLNRRLEDGESGVNAVAWLNAEPKVRAVLQAEFGGRPINEQNVSEWKQGGYVEWQKHQDALALARELAANAKELTEASGGSLADTVSLLLAGRYAALLRDLSAVTGAQGADLKMLRDVCSDLVALRKGDHSAERLRLERERLRWGV